MSAMNNNFQDGTRVSFHVANGAVMYGTVQSTSVLTDGTMMAVILPDGGGPTYSLPVTTLIRL